MYSFHKIDVCTGLNDFSMRLAAVDWVILVFI